LVIGINAVFLQQRTIFLFERHFAVMLFLIANIFHYGRSIRNAYAEGAVSLLPSEAASVFVHPFGRVCFEELDGLCKRHDRRQMKKHMSVVCHAIDRNCGHALITADAGHVRPKFRLDIVGYRGLTIFGAEDEMDMILDECMRHGYVALSGL
jgi:hypothetical protein